MTSPDEDAMRYRFPPLERRGVAGGLRIGQVAILAMASVAAVVLVRSTVTAAGLVAGMLLAGAGLLFAVVPVRERGVDQWAPVVCEWVIQRMTGGHQHRSATPYLGHRWSAAGLERELDVSPHLDGVELLAYSLADGQVLGILRDRRQHGYVAVLAASVRSFGLLGAADQERQLAAWGRVLASATRDATCIRRIQALERTVPHEGDELRDWLASAGICD